MEETLLFDLETTELQKWMEASGCLEGEEKYIQTSQTQWQR